MTTFDLLLQLAGKVLDKLPDWEQRKADEYHKMKKRFTELSQSLTHVRDDNEYSKLRKEMKDFIDSFQRYL